jgi:hypothetical protein
VKVEELEDAYLMVNEAKQGWGMKPAKPTKPAGEQLAD